jgi:putative transposase
MLTSEGFALFCQRLGLSSQARSVLATIRSSPPSRLVGGGGKNVPVRYISRKMGVTIQAESHKNEFAGVYEMEHDPTVLEFFDQPPPITLHYQARNGRDIGVLHTPDYFVLRADAAGWEEWKTEEDLLRLAEKMPHRYFRSQDGQWRCPPGERVAGPLGLYYRIRSSAEIPWTFLRNLSFLEDYLREDCPTVYEAVKEAVLAQVQGEPGIAPGELLTRVEGLRSDDIYTLIAQEQLYVDVYTIPLSELERVRVFCDEETARAWAVTLAEAHLPSMSNPHARLRSSGGSCRLGWPPLDHHKCWRNHDHFTGREKRCHRVAQHPLRGVGAAR